jgi:hypothetical protein
MSREECGNALSAVLQAAGRGKGLSLLTNPYHKVGLGLSPAFWRAWDDGWHCQDKAVYDRHCGWT